MDEEWILARLGWKVGLFEPKLLALVEKHLARQPEQEQQRGARACLSERTAAKAGHVTDDVVV